MNLLTTREQWGQSYRDGAVPTMYTTYKESRDSEQWRSSSIVEQLCEYILYLEGLDLNEFTNYERTLDQTHD